MKIKSIFGRLHDGATILQGVTFCEISIVAAGVVVSTNVPDNTFVGGITAKLIKKI